MGWSDDRDNSLAGEAGVQPGDLEDPELVQDLYEERDRPLGESSENQKEKEKQPAPAAPIAYQRRVSRVLGTFVIEAAHTAGQRNETQESFLELGESNRFPGMVVQDDADDSVKARVANITRWGRDGAAQKSSQVTEDRPTHKVAAADALDEKVKIAAAKHLLSEQSLPLGVKKLATDYLRQKERKREEIESATVRVLSKRLFEAKLGNAEMFQLHQMVTSQFKTPQIGKKYDIGLSGDGTDHILSMKVDGVEFDSGGSFTSPEGHIVSVKRCERYLSRYNDKEKVKEAADNLKKYKSLYDVAHTKARELSQKAIVSREAAKVGSTGLGESSRAQELEQDRKIVEADAGMDKAASAVKAAKLAKRNLKQAKLKFQQAESSELSNKDKMIRNDNVDAREAEVAEREKRIAEREHVYQMAADKLKLAASNLASASETEAVKSFPENERKLKLEKRSLKAQEESMQKREQALRHKAEILATRMHAFDSAVKHIIENSAKSSEGIANDWTNDAENKVASEVDGFAAALKQIKAKFSSSNTHEAKAARDGAKIMTAVHDAVEHSTRRMHEAHLIQKKGLAKEMVERKTHSDAANKTAHLVHDTANGKWSAHHGKQSVNEKQVEKADISQDPKITH